MIEGEIDILVDFNIFFGDLLWVIDLDIYEYRDIVGNRIIFVSK